MEIKRNSLDDGPGIRSTVFFKGCPLNCVWCHNPECIESAPEIIFRAEPCIGCKTCVKTCPKGAIIEPDGPARIDREKCDLCGECVDECPSGALSIVGKYYAQDELVAELARDKPFYDNSNGGVTLSGGEPTLPMEYSAEVARKLKELGIHVCIETCGDFNWDAFKEKLLPSVDLVYVDMKLVDEAAHKKFTGRGNERIERNIENLIEFGKVPLLIRVPLVPDVTATRENLEATAKWMREHNQSKVALLPYNPLWIGKAKGLGKNLSYSRSAWMSQEEREKIKKIFDGFEIERDI